jgi:arginyl-tRNA synthetase
MSGTRIENILTEKTIEAIKALFEQSISPNQVTLQKTKTEFEGDITLLVFPLTKVSKKSPEQTAEAIGNYLKENVKEVTAYNVVKGFLNLVIADSYWTNYLLNPSTINHQPSTITETVMVEFSSPNTNKPLHLGHIRNNLLGASVSEILKTAGKKVIRVNLVNDRGIHICKSMLAWKKWGNGETPASSGMKGDHLVGKYYVRFEIEYKEDLNLAEAKTKEWYSKIQEIIKLKGGIPNFVWIAGVVVVIIAVYLANKLTNKLFEFNDKDIDEISENGFETWEEKKNLIDQHTKNEIIQTKNEVEVELSKYKLPQDEKEQYNKLLEVIKKRFDPIKEVQEMLRKWEAGDKETIELWEKMNGWVYDGFAVTYKSLGVEFEKTYYESQTYLLGKEIVEEGLKKNVFKKKDDGSVWIDLTKDGLDEKLLLRSDGTSVYMTQDLGTAIKRQEEFNFNRLVYVVGNEQDYHFKVLFLILKKLGYDWAKNLFHLSYGMVDLPSGKMKSREGTVVDADDLISEMVNTARDTTKALGKTEGMSESEAETLYHSIGLGALKYFILKVDPKKRMLFDPKESIDFNGNTGPFIQYTYARIKSVLRKAIQNSEFRIQNSEFEIQKKEKDVIKLLHDFPTIIKEAAEAYSPAYIANYVYELAKEYNQFYHEFQILKAEKEEEKNFRLLLSAKTAEVLESSLKLLGINAPERM